MPNAKYQIPNAKCGKKDKENQVCGSGNQEPRGEFLFFLVSEILDFRY
jgi:hypothetical protein